MIPAWLLLVIAAALVPLSEIASAGTLVNALTPSPLAGLTADQARVTLVAGALAAGALVILIPRRFAWTTAVVVGVGLALVSVDTRQRIADASEQEDRVAIGSAPPSWIDEAGLTDATLLVTGDRLWTSVARTYFWNRGIGEVLRLAPATLPFPTPRPPSRPGTTASCATRDGAPLARRRGHAVDDHPRGREAGRATCVGDSEASGLTAWRPATPARMLLRVDGLLPNGDFAGHARVTVFDCRPGTLDVTILGKTGDPIRAYVDGFEVATLETPAGSAGTHRIPAPPYANGKRLCIFDLENPGYAGTTTIVFSPRRALSVLAGERVVGSVSASIASRAASRSPAGTRSRTGASPCSSGCSSTALSSVAGIPARVEERLELLGLVDAARDRDLHELAHAPDPTSCRRARRPPRSTSCGSPRSGSGTSITSKSRGTTVRGNTRHASSATSPPA